MENKEKNYIENLMKSYQGKETSKLEQLRQLDKRVKRPATVFAYVFGTIGALVLGFGMCLAMEVLFDLMPLGIVIGIVGIFMVSVNYFLYQRILDRRKNKYTSEIMELSKSLLNE